MNNVIYRKATPADAYEIEFVAAHSWNETYSDFMPKEYLANRIATIKDKVSRAEKYLSETDNYYVAEKDNQVVGIMQFSISQDERFNNYGKLNAIYLLKKYQGLGIGKELFKIAVNGLINLGYNKMYLECITNNPTMGFYEYYYGNAIEVIDYPIRDFSVKANIVVFDDLSKTMQKLNRTIKE